MTPLLPTLRALHQQGLLILPNAWDAGSARLFEATGAQAIATSSSAMSWAHGVPDGEHLTQPMRVASLTEIVRAVRVPVSVDLEAGYGATAEAIVPAVRAVLDAGAVGINLEDGDGAPSLLAEKIASAKRVAAAAGVDLFLNARTDVYLHALVPPERRVEETLARAARYREAGADGLFVPGIVEEEAIQEIARGCGLPLNVLARPGLPVPARLEALGVRRLSLGGSLAQAALGLVRGLCQDVLQRGEYGALFANQLPYAEMNALFR